MASSIPYSYIGYGLSIPGNIIANSGFIDVFATEVDPRTGAKVLSATHVSLWGGTQFAVQILFQVLSPLTSDRFGVKVNLYIPTVAIVIVSDRLDPPSHDEALMYTFATHLLRPSSWKSLPKTGKSFWQPRSLLVSPTRTWVPDWSATSRRFHSPRFVAQ